MNNDMIYNIVFYSALAGFAFMAISLPLYVAYWVLRKIQQTYPVERRWIWVKNAWLRFRLVAWEVKTLYATGQLWMRVREIIHRRKNRYWLIGLKSAGAVAIIALVFVGMTTLHKSLRSQEHKEPGKSSVQPVLVKVTPAPAVPAQTSTTPPVRQILVTPDNPSEVISMSNMVSVDEVDGRKIAYLDFNGRPVGEPVAFPKGNIVLPHWVRKIQFLAGGEPYIVTVKS